MKNEIIEIEEKYCDILEKYLNEIKQIEFLIVGNLFFLKEFEEFNDVFVIVEYRFRIKEFRKFFVKVYVILFLFFLKYINGEQFYEIIGFIKFLVLIIGEDGYRIKLLEILFRMLLDMFEVIKMFNIGYKEFCSIFFYSEEKIWISVRIKDIKCFSVDGNFIKIILIELGMLLNDIVVICV